MAGDKRVQKSLKRDKPTITKKQLERLVTITNGGPINNIKRSGSEEPEFAPSPSTSTLTSRPKEADVTNVKPAIQKPTFDFKSLMSQSGLGSQLPSFLEQMRAANDELEAERRAGTIQNRKIEIDDTSSEEETSSDEDEDDDDDEMGEGEVMEKKVKEKKEKPKKEKKERGQYIEMNLGLGVLEEKNSDDETSSSGSSDEGDEDGDEKMGVMDRLEGKDKEDVEGRKKVGIEVVKEA